MSDAPTNTANAAKDLPKNPIQLGDGLTPIRKVIENHAVNGSVEETLDGLVKKSLADKKITSGEEFEQVMNNLSQRAGFVESHEDTLKKFVKESGAAGLLSIGEFEKKYGEQILSAIPNEENTVNFLKSQMDIIHPGHGLADEVFTEAAKNRTALAKTKLSASTKMLSEEAEKLFANPEVGGASGWADRVGSRVKANWKGVTANVDGVEKTLVEAKPWRMGVGGSVSLVAAGDGVRRMWNGVTGVENPETGEKDGWGTVALGAAESVASLALLSKVATGRANAFRL